MKLLRDLSGHFFIFLSEKNLQEILIYLYLLMLEIIVKAAKDSCKMEIKPGILHIFWMHVSNSDKSNFD